MLEEIKQILFEAKDEVMKIYNSDNFETEMKSDNSPVTDADLKANEIICNGLANISEFPIITEESDFDSETNYDTYWLVDPIDGTKCFVDRTPEFSIMIAQIENGFLKQGFVLIPAKNELYYAIRGRGAYLEIDGKTTKLNINSNKDLENFTMVTSRHHFSENDKELSKEMKIKNFQPLGSIGTKLCNIASGESDIYLNLKGLNQWDLAPGHIILEEAGGIIFDNDGNSFKFKSNVERFENGVIAISNEREKDEIVRIINNEIGGKS